ncbi:CsxC family protein [Clostridium sp.]|uniref:CsxC family protein n=1 Tax=Clostridium sp. TaxID=1506 RepID=UPI003D6CE770
MQIDVEAEFRLQEPYFEIKRIKKNVYLTQCELLPRTNVSPIGIPISGKLFISGFVRKNIEYATADCVEDKIVSGRIAHTTIDVPFTTVTEVIYAIAPIINVRGIQTEIDYLSGCACHDCTGTVIGKLGCQQSFEDVVPFTEKPYCELELVRIIEEDLHRNPVDTYSEFNVQLYDKVIEKMVIYVTVKVLQLQQVNIL